MVKMLVGGFSGVGSFFYLVWLVFFGMKGVVLLLVVGIVVIVNAAIGNYLRILELRFLFCVFGSFK